MSTVILAEKPSQALAYASALKQSTKKDGYFEIKDPLFTDETFITFGFGQNKNVGFRQQELSAIASLDFISHTIRLAGNLEHFDMMNQSVKDRCRDFWALKQFTPSR